MAATGAFFAALYAGVSQVPEIDENLARNQLDAAQEALAIQRRAEIIADMEAENRGGEPGNILPGIGKGGRGRKEKKPGGNPDLAASKASAGRPCGRPASASKPSAPRHSSA